MMDNKKFKQLFNDVARLYDFEQAYGAWFLESPECSSTSYRVLYHHQ